MSLRTLRRLPLLLLLLCLALPAFAATPDLYVTNAQDALLQCFNGRTGAPVSLFNTGRNPAGVALGPDGALYVADFSDADVVRCDPATGTSGLFVAPGAGGLFYPVGIAFGPDKDLYVTCGGGSVLRYDGKTGAPLGVFVSSGSGGLSSVYGVAFGPDGDLYAASAATNSILRYDGKTGAFVDAFVPGGSGGLSYPTSFAFGPDGGLYVASNGTSSVLRYDGKTGAFADTFVASGSGGLSNAFGVAFGPDGGLYVTGGGSDSSDVLRFDGTTGAFGSVLATLASQPGFLTFGPGSRPVTGPLSLSVSPAYVPSGSPAALTVTLSQPAPASGPIPAQPGQTAPGGFVRLSSSTPGVTFRLGQTADGGTVFQGNDGAFYVFVPAGGRVATVPLATSSVPQSVRATLSGQYEGGEAETPLVLLANSVASLTFSPPAVSNGQSSTATLTLSYPAAPGPDPSDPGQTSGGAVVLLGSDSPAVTFQTSYTFDSNDFLSGAVFRAQDGRWYAYLRAGLTSLTFPVNTGFVPARTAAHVSATLNGVARIGGLTITPTLVASLTVNPKAVPNGQSAMATLTLNAPSVPGPDPSRPGQTSGGSVVLLGSDSPAATFKTTYFFDSNDYLQSAILQAPDGRWYAYVGAGQTSLTFPVVTGSVAAATPIHLSATLNGTAQTTVLVVTPTRLASLTLTPAQVPSGQSSMATLTLSSPSVPGPDPSRPGQTSGGSVVLLGSDSPAVTFKTSYFFDSNDYLQSAVLQAPDGRWYAYVGAGQTSLTFPVLTGYVPAKTTAQVSATLNGSVRTASLTVTPTLVSSLSCSPAAVPGGQSSTATLTLNAPAVSGPDPSNPGQTSYGTIVLLGSSSPAVQFTFSYVADGGGNLLGEVYQAQDGHWYAYVQPGQASLAFPVNTSAVTAVTKARVSATLNGEARSALLTVQPTPAAP